MVEHRTITTGVTQITMEAGYLRIKFFDTENSFDLAEAKEQYRAVKMLSDGKHYKALIDIRNTYVSPEKEAQEFLSQIEEKIAEAILVDSLAAHIISKFYAKKAVKSPVKIFRNESKAIEWLFKQ